MRSHGAHSNKKMRKISPGVGVRMPTLEFLCRGFPDPKTTNMGTFEGGVPVIGVQLKRTISGVGDYFGGL